MDTEKGIVDSLSSAEEYFFYKIMDLPRSIPSVLALPAKIKAVLFDANEKRMKAAIEDARRKTPMRTAAKSGSK